MMVLLNDHYVPDPVLSPLVLEAGAIIILIFRCRNRGTKRVNQLPKVSHLVNGSLVTEPVLFA